MNADQPAESLRFELVAPGQVRVGDSVPITLRLTNPTDHTVEAHFLGRTVAFDVTVAREDGTPVWRRLAGQTVPSILQVRVLGPGETLEFRDVWRQRTDAGEPVAPGVYTIQGILPSDEPEPRRTPPQRLRITPR